jgi:hypothetical protein
MGICHRLTGRGDALHPELAKSGIANSQSAAHNDQMEAGPTSSAIVRWFAAVGTIVIAWSVGYIAHYDFGFSEREIRTPAIVGAAVIGLLVATEHFGKKLRKPK